MKIKKKKKIFTKDFIFRQIAFIIPVVILNYFYQIVFLDLVLLFLFGFILNLNNDKLEKVWKKIPLMNKLDKKLKNERLAKLIENPPTIK